MIIDRILRIWGFGKQNNIVTERHLVECLDDIAWGQVFNYKYEYSENIKYKYSENMKYKILNFKDVF